MPSSRICFQPNSFSAPLIPSGSANAAISAAITPTRATTTPICLLDTLWGDYLAGRGGWRPRTALTRRRTLFTHS
jgi:hypothetical protein